MGGYQVAIDVGSLSQIVEAPKVPVADAIV
jgi:hypothetical protein